MLAHIAADVWSSLPPTLNLGSWGCGCINPFGLALGMHRHAHGLDPYLGVYGCAVRIYAAEPKLPRCCALGGMVGIIYSVAY